MGEPDVLIVDDDPDIRAMLAYTLSGEFTVRMAAGGRDAIDELTHRPPAAMLLDVSMPDLDGFAVLQARRDGHLAPHTRVIMLSCYSHERDLVRSWSLGADAYLTKPADPATIVAELRTHLAKTNV